MGFAKNNENNFPPVKNEWYFILFDYFRERKKGGLKVELPTLGFDPTPLPSTLEANKLL